MPNIVTTVNVLSWNVHWGVARVPDKPKAMPFDPLVEVELMAPGLLARTDVAVFPEAFRDHAGSSFLDGIAALGFEHVVETKFRPLTVSVPRRELNEPGEGFWNLAVASRHPILETREIALKPSINDVVPVRHARSIRIAPDGREVDITAFHPSSKVWLWASQTQLRGLHASMQAHELDGRHRPAIMAGDGNIWRSWLPALLPGWRSTAKGRTFPSWRPHSQIDHILIRGAIDEIDSAVLPYSPSSDHRAVRASLQLR